MSNKSDRRGFLRQFALTAVAGLGVTLLPAAANASQRGPTTGESFCRYVCSVSSFCNNCVTSGKVGTFYECRDVCTGRTWTGCYSGKPCGNWCYALGTTCG